MAGALSPFFPLQPSPAFRRKVPSLPLRRLKVVRCAVSTGLPERETVPWGCEIESLENASALQRWLSSSGLPAQKMEIERVEVGGRGLVALKNIRKGEKLLFVPPSLVITADSVSLPSPLLQKFVLLKNQEKVYVLFCC